jgi:hypothetical protein
MESGGGRWNAETAPKKEGGQGAKFSTKPSKNKHRKGRED